MSKPKAPKAPDPYQVAGADYAYNNPSQYTPYGNLINTPPTFGAGNRPLTSGTSRLELTPELQGILNNQLAVEGGTTAEALRRLPELSNLPTMPEYDPQRYTDALFAKQRGLLDPVFSEQERGLRDMLANQGLAPGGEAYGYDVGIFDKERNDSYRQAALDSILSGQTMGAQDLQLGAFQRQQPFNEIASLLGLQQTQMPQLANFYTPRGADFTGAQALNAQVQSANYQQRAGMFNNLMAGLFGLGKSAMGMPGG